MFTLNKDIDFGYKIIINIVYLNRKPLHDVGDAAIVFEIGQFFNNILAKKT